MDLYAITHYTFYRISCAGISADDEEEEDEEEVVITPANKKAVLAAQKAKLEAEKVS